MRQSKITEIGAFVHPNAGIGAQHRCQLTAADIDGNDLITAAFQQHLSEAAGGRTGVQSASGNPELEIVQGADQLLGTTGYIVIIGSGNRSRRGYPLIRSHHDRAIDNDLACIDHGLSLTTRSSQPALDQLAVEPLGHCLSRLGAVGRSSTGITSAGLNSAGLATAVVLDVVRSIVAGSIKRLLHYLVCLGEPVVMLGKRS
jgi:hypothetical protein